MMLRHIFFPTIEWGPQVLQRYIDKPQLIQGPTFGHKFSIRELLVVSTHVGSALFPSGYLNIALKPYQEDNFNLLEAHLTNEHLSDERLNVVQRLSDDMAIFQPYKQGIISMCQLVVKSLKSNLPLFGKIASLELLVLVLILWSKQRVISFGYWK